MQKTVLHEKHLQSGARMGPFAGFEMPIQYRGIIAEHEHTRKNVSIFDTCHMGECHLEGPTALHDIERLLTADISSMSIGQCRYSLMCNESGGVIDDLLVYRIGDNHFMLVINAGTRQSDIDWISGNISPSTILRDVTEQTAKIDIQGPESANLMQLVMDRDIMEMKFFRFSHNSFRGQMVLISRTGYTGELGYEVYCDNITATQLWDTFLNNGAQPAGLGARDTLRLEMGMPLYGHELTTTTNAAATGLDRAISKTKEFIGCNSIRNIAANTPLLRGIAVDGRRSAREGDRLVVNDSEVGFVTSGSYAPSLGHAIALGYINPDFATEGTVLQIKGERTLLQGCVTPLPFYKNATARIKQTAD